MNTTHRTVKFLGAAFLLQAIASLVSNIILLDPLIVAGDIIATMTNIANNAMQVRVSIVLEGVTAIGVVILGSLLYITLKKQNKPIALVALGLYIIEAAILAASRIEAFSLLQISQQSVLAGHPDYLQTLGSLFYQSQDFGNWMHMLPFVVGAALFYGLFYKSGYLPRGLAILGLVAAAVSLVGTPLLLLGYDIPLLIFLPNLPFEVGMGLWLLVKGIRDESTP